MVSKRKTIRKRRSRRNKRSRRKTTRIARIRPEVKFRFLNQTGDFRTLVTNASDLSNTDYRTLFIYPSQGTSDSSRIGDTLTPVKFWTRITFHNSIFTPNIPSYQIRIIIFTLPNLQVTSSPIVGFWQTATQLPVTQGVIDREVVHKVYYDKRFVINQNFSGQTIMRKPLSINIRFKKPIVFSNGSIVPKDARNIVYFAIFAYDTVTVTDAATGKFQIGTNFYYMDS